MKIQRSDTGDRDSSDSPGSSDSVEETDCRSNSRDRDVEPEQRRAQQRNLRLLNGMLASVCVARSARPLWRQVVPQTVRERVWR
jgi:hypothetical protein